MVRGDFNEIMYDYEKEGGCLRSHGFMCAFREIMDDCGLADLKSKCDLFTWYNKRAGDNISFERLDRYICNCDWRMVYPFDEVSNLELYGSDHHPILIILKPHGFINIQHNHMRFFFEHKRLMEEDLSFFISAGGLSIMLWMCHLN